jgi:DNA-binding SARP family transcriptional activator/tetratricopeptide (TPR) repeat protein
MRRVGGRTVRVLGELSADGVDLRAGLDRKARTVLRLLALARGRAVGADALAQALWGDRPPARPADQLAVLVSRIRRLLGRETIAYGDGGYRLDGILLDLDELETMTTETERRLAEGRLTGAVATARIALALVRGPLPEADGDTDWASADHAAAVRLVGRARRSATEALQRTGLWPEALELASADLTLDPYDEAAARAVMRAEVAAGRPARALQVFADLRGVLAEELGTDPAAETAELHAEVLRGEATAAVRARHRPLVIGRISQLDHLDSLAARLGEGKVRVAVVAGEAGIGKTTLLRAWSQSRRDAGETVLTGTCGTLDAAAPLDVVLTAIDDHLRHSRDAAALLGDEATLLGPVWGRGPVVPGKASDPILGPASLYAAVTQVLARIAGDRGAVLVLDDAHLAGPALADWLEFARRRALPLLVVAGVRPAEGARLPATDEIGLGPFGLSETAELVGAERAADLHARSGGHPLFLSELAGAGDGDLPASLVAAVRSRCDELGGAGELVRSAAVLGGSLDVEVLAEVLALPALEVLRRIEVAAERGLLVERAGRYSFRHDLVRGALAADAPPSRAELLHRGAARALAARSGDPLSIADHARRGGDRALAARALADAADRASARFDHATASRLLEESFDLAPDPAVLLARARVRIRIGRYVEAEDDGLDSGTSDGATTAAWAAYFDRRFGTAIEHARDAERSAAAEDDRARALIAEGRVLHARGDLDEAEGCLERSLTGAHGTDRVTASAWLGVLRSHRSRPAEALELLRPATRPGVGVEHTSVALHALLFTGHALAVAGRPADALAAFASYTDEVERRQVPRFAGRGLNFGGWVLRNLGSTAAGHDAHQAALEVAELGGTGTAEMAIAVHQDLAEERLIAADPDGAAAHLDRARAGMRGDLVFGWRLALKLRLHEARLALLREEYEEAEVRAADLRSEARGRGVPRYAATAALLVHQARARAGAPVDPTTVGRDLEHATSAVGVEAWWWTGDTAAALGNRDLLRRAEDQVVLLAAHAGDHAATLRAAADRRIEAWSVSAR